MSLFLSRLSKPRNDYLLTQKLGKWSSRFLSSSLPYRLPPYYILDVRGETTRFVTLNDGDFGYSEKKMPSELLEARATFGASHGWVGTLKKGEVYLQDTMNMNVSADSNPKSISLPSLESLPHCQTRIVTNLAMPTSSPFDDDCVVAVKFLGPQLSMCRPVHDLSWTNIRINDPNFYTSRVMFSKRDQAFSLPGSGCDHIGSWDLLKHRNDPKWQKLHFQTFPRMKKEMLFSCYRTEHLVESSAGETFLVIWYRYPDKENESCFRVFRLDEQGNGTYTQDIGYLCIFLSKAEPFCLPASSFPGFESTYIYYVDFNQSDDYIENGAFGLQDSTHNFQDDRDCNVPYIFPPQFI